MAGDGTSQPRRKRNVVSRDRLGCISCRARHLRCDYAKPECMNCVRTNRQCEGYTNPITFRDQTKSVVQRNQTRRARHKNAGVQEKPLANPPLIPPTSSPPRPPLPPLALGDDNNTLVNSFAQDSIDPLSIELSAEVVTLTEFDFNSLTAFDDVDWSLNWLGAQPEIDTSSDSDNNIASADDQSPPTDQVDDSWLSGMSAPNDPNNVSLDADDDLLQMIPAPSNCEYVHPAFAAFQFSPDHDYYRYICNGSISGFTTIMPIVQLISDERLASTYLYSAALAISALSVSSVPQQSQEKLCSALSSPIPKAVAKRHALRHYSSALKSLACAFPSCSPDSFQDVSTEDLLSWLTTRLLMSNIDLRLGFLTAWRAHLRAVGGVISLWHDRISQSPQGKSLIQTFARMALLLELQNEDFSVTKQTTMNPCVAAELNLLIEHSSSPRDRLLALIRKVSKVETKYRLRPNEGQKWIAKMEKVERDLFEWQKSLPSSELPVDSAIAGLMGFDDHEPDGINLAPLTFPNSSDPYTAAVNYAHFLCARMRSRTRYGLISELLPPKDAEATTQYICRIAAGLNPSDCKQVDAYGHGMMPAIVGAYRWSKDHKLRAWIVEWMKGYGLGAREGLWNVDRTRRLMVFIEEHLGDVAYKEWHLIIARITEEGEDENSVLDNTAAWGMLVARAANDEVIEKVRNGRDASGPFRAVLYIRSSKGPATQHLTIP